jgi:rare lipoprotein A
MGFDLFGLNFWMVAGFAFAFGMASGDAFAANPKQFSGAASFYDKDYQGRTASGSAYDSAKLTCAHRNLPFGTRISVSDPRTHRVVTVVVNDRGPFVKGRVLDLSYAAAQALHMTARGVINVTAAVE